MDIREKKTFAIVYTDFILNGMLALSTGSLLPFIRDARGLDYAQAGLIVSLHSVGNLFSSFFSGILAGRIGRKGSILIFNMFFPAAYVLILTGHGFPVIALAFLLTGIARGATSNYCNSVINELVPGNAAVLNGLHAMFSIGAFSFPLILTLITSGSPDKWVYACIFMIAMGVLSFLLYAVCPGTGGSKTAEKTGRKQDKPLGFLGERVFFVVTATLFFYLCAESGVIGWMVTYFTDTGYISPELSQLTASILWIMILLGRTLTAFLSGRTDKGRLLIIMGSGIVIFFILLLFARNVFMIIPCIMAFGLFMAGIYPTTVSFAGELINRYPLAWSFILTTASLGAVLMPAIVGRVAESAGIIPGIATIAVAVVVNFICILLLVKQKS